MIDRLFLNEQEVDLDEKSIIALTSQIEDIASVSTKNVSFSYTIAIPMTLRNRMIMESCELTTSSSELPYRKMKAKVLKNGIEVVPYGIGIVTGTGESYEVQITFGGIDFWDAIDGKMLSELGQIDNSVVRLSGATAFTDFLFTYGSVSGITIGASSFKLNAFAAALEDGFLAYDASTLQYDRAATFKVEVRTGQWDGLLSNGPQELQAFFYGQFYTIEKDVKPNTTYIRYFHVTVDRFNVSYLCNPYGYGVNLFSTFAASGDINEIVFLEITESPSIASMNHVFGIEAIENSRTNQGGYKYPVIDYGDLDNVVRTINPKNQRVGVFSSLLVEAIIKEAGFEPRGKLFDDVRFLKQIHPFTNDKLQRSKKWIDDHSFRVHVEDTTIAAPGIGPVTFNYLGIDDKTSTGYYDNNSDVTLGSWVVVSGPPNAYWNNPEPAKFKYTLNINFTISGWVSAAASSFQIELAGEMLYRHEESGFGDGAFQKTLTIVIDRENVVAFPIDTAFTSSFNCQFQISNTVFERAPAEDVFYGSTYEIAPNLDNISQKDFMKAIMLQYCVVPDIKKFSNEVHLRFFNEIIDNKAIAVDWSSKYNKKKKPATDFTIGDYARKNLLEFAEDSEDKNIIKGYGDGFFLIDNDNLKGSKTAASLPFAASVSDNRLIQLLVPIIKKIDDNGLFNGKTKPRVLIDSTQDITTGDVTWDDGVDTFVTSKSIPMCYFASGSIYDLWFVPFNGATGFGLVQSYWQGIINALKNARGLKADLALTPADFAEMDHFLPVYLDSEGSIFYVNKIPKFIGNKEQSTETEIIKI